MSLGEQFGFLFLLAIPVACISWTVIKEEVFKEPREYCMRKSKACRSLFERKVFYLFTCEYCFSHYVALFFLVLTRFHLLLPDWRGYLIGGFALVWVANIYMSLFGFIRVGMKKEKMNADIQEIRLKEEKADEKSDPAA